MKKLPIVIVISAALAMLAPPAYADDGERLVRSVSNPLGIDLDPEPEGEHAFIKLMNFHVPAQLANGDLTTIEYFNIDDVLVKEEFIAKPLVNVYVFGPVVGFDNPEASGFAGHGRRDAFAAVSLDDGETWKETNLSNSADQSSFVVSTALQDPGVSIGEATDPVETSVTPILDSALFELSGKKNTLTVIGVDAQPKAQVEIRNANTQNVIGSVKAKKDGSFTFTKKDMAEVPCKVQAGDETGWGPTLEVEDAPDGCNDGSATLITDYPGDVPNVFHAVAGNKVLVAWHSKFCSSGNPVWGDTFDTDGVGGYLGINNETDLYLTDMFGAAGSQSSTNYNELDAEPVGEVPYSCLWSARGVIRENPEALGTTEMVWFQAERLTAGSRDVNRVETACVAGAGCAITWQEDPEGVRPGEGEGPGTGWSGATTASKTDIWYSFIEWEDFDIINDDDAPVPLADNITDAGRPPVYVPMMAAVRLTNNDRCVFTEGEEGEPGGAASGDYCEDAVAAPYGIIDQCVGSVEVPLGPQDNLQPICVVDSNNDGSMNAGDMPNLANTAASRPRLNMQPRDSDGDGIVDDAWVIVVSEEDKGLGAFGFQNDLAWALDNLDDTGTVCELPDDESVDSNCVKADQGKDVFWASFNLGSPNTSAGVGVDYSLVSNVLVQGAQLNQPEVNWITGTYFPPMDTEDMWDFTDGVEGGADLNYLIFNTEIARRTSMMSQSVAKATNGGTQDGLVAMPLWKQGIVNQGGPADISTRRIVAPADVDETTENPYAGSNIVCAWYDGEGVETEGVMYFTDGMNPYYPNGLCMAQPINLSARTPYECEESGEDSDGLCPGDSDMTCVDDVKFGLLCSSVNDPENSKVYDKMTSWYECPGWNGNNVSNDAAANPATCGTELDSVLIGANTDDVSWYNPLEVAKAHRGFLDGNHVMMIYAWSPNFKLNSVGHDRYELYTRRSFDGGITWGTTPTSFTASDGLAYSGSGTTTCETMRDNDSINTTHMCTEYAAGDPEQSRNVSQLKSMANTILDPRYTPTAAGMVESDFSGEWATFTPIGPTDIRDPSRNFVVYEDGDNTTVIFGEAEPLNLAYGRAERFGDHFTVWSEIDTGVSDPVTDCYPSNAHGDDSVAWAAGTGFCHEFDTLEGFQDALSEEASITASAGGDFLYAVWGQFNVDENHEFTDGDSMFRRVWYLDDYISTENAYTLPGTQSE